jgi:O-antigen/teichoic acid export membrane protein
LILVDPHKNLDGNVIKKSSPETATPKSVRMSHGHILRSVLGNWSYLVIVSIVAFAMTPFVVRHLGNAAYGIWALVLQLTGYMGVVDVGLRSALVRFVSSANTKSDQLGISRLLSSAMMIYGVMAPLSILVGVFLAVFALPRMHIGSDMLRTAQITLLISALIMASDFLFATFHAGLAGLSRWDLINAVGISAVLIRTILIIASIRHGYGLITLALIQLGTTLASYLVEMLMVRRLIPGLRFIWKKPDRQEFAPVLQHSWYSFLLSLANRINYQVDTVVIAIFLPIGEVTFYVIGLRLIEYLRDVLNSTTMIASPLVSSLEAAGESDRVVALLIRGTKYSLLVAFLGVAIFLALGTKFIGLWMGPTFAAPSGRVLVILSVGLLVSATQFASSHVLYGLGRHRINLNWTIVESLINLAFSILLVRKYGIFGVAAGTTIANILVRGWFYPRSVLKDLGVPGEKYLREAVLPSIPPIVAFLAGSLTYTHFFSIPNYASWFLAVGAGLLPFLIFLWFFALDLPERKLIRHRVGVIS